MKVLIRTDASVEIGSGHLMRCLTLADQLRGEGAEVAFVCRDLPGGMFDLLDARGYRSAKLPLVEAGKGAQQFDAEETTKAAGQLFPEGVDWLVVDHYELDAVWESTLRPHTRKIMVIDDLANRRHDCDLLLDQNYYRDQDLRYQGLVSEQCVTLLGPVYVLLRPEFVDARKRLKLRDGIVRRILVFFGGSDLSKETLKTMDAISRVRRTDISVDIVIGTNNPYKEEIEAAAALYPNMTCHFRINHMANLMINADMYIGAAGTTTWERFCLGLPSLVVTVADNQVRTTMDMAKDDLLYFIGEGNKVNVNEIKSVLSYYFANPDILNRYAANSMKIVDGLGSLRCRDEIYCFKLCTKYR